MKVQELEYNATILSPQQPINSVGPNRFWTNGGMTDEIEIFMLV